MVELRNVIDKGLDKELIQQILAFVRERGGQVSVVEIGEQFGDKGLLYSGYMTACQMLFAVSGGGEVPYILQLGD